MIPIREGEFKLCSTKTFQSLLIWFCIPIGLYSTVMWMVVFSDSQSYLSDTIITTCWIAMAINIVSTTMLIPGLMANLVEKSEINYDAIKFSKLWPLLYTLAAIVSVTLTIYNYQYVDGSLYLSIAFTVFFSMLNVLMGSFFVTTSLISISFLDEAKEMSTIQDAELMISSSMNQVKKIRMLKSGFSPLLAFMLTNSTVCLVIFSYTGLYYSKKKQYYQCLSFLSCVPGFCLPIYSLICCCNDIYLALSLNNDKLRYNITKIRFTVLIH